MAVNNEKVYKSFLKATSNLIDVYKGAEKKNRKIKYLPEWLDFYTKQLLQENNKKFKLYPTYKRGTIIYVNLGSNIGNEFSGNHFCVVLDKNDNSKKTTITVIPLSSKESNHYTQLTSSIFDITIKALNKKADQLIEEADTIEDFANSVMNKHEDYLKARAKRVAILIKHKYLSEEYIQKEYAKFETLVYEEAKDFKRNIDKLKRRADNIKSVQNIFNRHQNKQSYANVSAITTISKKRIKKINNEDPTGTIRINNEDLKNIEKQIKIRFIKS